jgi:hypothetical protein
MQTCDATLWFADSGGVANATDNPSDCFVSEARLPCVTASWRCTDYPVASLSGTLSGNVIASPSADLMTAMHGLSYIIWISFAIIIFFNAVQFGLSFYGRK